MRIIIIITCLVNLVFAFGFSPWMPKVTEYQFSLFVINAVGTNVTAVIFIVGILYMRRHLATLSPTSCEWNNIPNRNYWLNEANYPKMIQRQTAHFELFCPCMWLLFLFPVWSGFCFPQTTVSVIVIKLGLYFCFLVAFLIMMFVYSRRLFRLPKDVKPKESEESDKISGDAR
jgi:uncharacterized membrane protein YcgQ (UPF0703/DUF1980 family)